MAKESDANRGIRAGIAPFHDIRRQSSRLHACEDDFPLLRAEGQRSTCTPTSSPSLAVRQSDTAPNVSALAATERSFPSSEVDIDVAPSYLRSA